MEITGGRLVAKGGAEGYQCIGLMPGALGSRSLAVGIAFKIADGVSRGSVRSAVAIEILRQLGALSQQELSLLEQYGPMITVSNWRKLAVGQGRPIFSLNRRA
jgi:L-asparaginase II